MPPPHTDRKSQTIANFLLKRNLIGPLWSWLIAAQSHSNFCLRPPFNRGTASEWTFHLARQVTAKLFSGLFSMYLFVPLGALEDVGMEYVQMYVRHLCLVFFLLGVVGGQVLPEVSHINSESIQPWHSWAPPSSGTNFILANKQTLEDSYLLIWQSEQRSLICMCIREGPDVALGLKRTNGMERWKRLLGAVDQSLLPAKIWNEMTLQHPAPSPVSHGRRLEQIQAPLGRRWRERWPVCSAPSQQLSCFRQIA